MPRRKKASPKAAPVDIDALMDETAAEVVERSAPKEPTDNTSSAEALRWAKDIHDVSCWIGDRPTKAKAGTQFRFAMWKYANESTDQFMAQLLPKAMQILDRYVAKNSGNDEMARVEEKGVKELERILKGVVHEAIVTGSPASSK